MFRIRTNRLRAAMAAALFSLTLAAPALAERGRWDDDDRYRRNYPVHRHDRRCDHDQRGDRHQRWGHERNWGRDRGHWQREHRRHEYGCRPCGRRWGNESHFHHHLASDHGVPYRAIPRALVAVDFGWLFHG
jgi:hypothetical protein